MTYHLHNNTRQFYVNVTAPYMLYPKFKFLHGQVQNMSYFPNDRQHLYEKTVLPSQSELNHKGFIICCSQKDLKSDSHSDTS